MPRLEDLKVYNGVPFDPVTGKSYFPAREGEVLQETPYTFERATWTGPFGLVIAWPWLNPMNFATIKTALKVHRLCVLELDQLSRQRGVIFTAVARNDQTIVGPFTRTIERRIEIRVGGRVVEEFSAGLIAAKMILRGEQEALQGWKAEVIQSYANNRWVD